MIRKIPLLITFVALLAGCTTTTAPETGYAWWLIAEFEPHGKSVWGVPVKRLNEDWSEARLLETSDVKNTGKDRVREEMEQYGLSFQLAADFDKDGDVERAGVGVFEREDGTKGSFLLVVGPNSEVEFLEITSATEAAFGVIRMEKDGLSHWYCLACDHGFDLRATGPDSFEVIVPEPFG